MNKQAKLKFLTRGMSAKETNFIAAIIDALEGTGAESDLEIEDYLSSKQLKWIDTIYSKYA